MLFGGVWPDLPVRVKFLLDDNAIMADELLTTSEAAKRLGVSLRAVQKMIEHGRLTAKKVGRDYLIRAEDLSNIKRRSNAGRPSKSSTMTKKTGTRKATGKKKS
jgi:excisionase family DNA binding protein